ELALGEAIHAVILGDIDHVDAAADAMDELAKPDRSGIAIARHAQIDQILVGEIGARQDRRHAAMHRIEAVALAQEIGRRRGRTADARQFGHPVRLNGEFETGGDDGGRDRVMAATGAKGRDHAFVIAPCIAQLVFRQRGMAEPGFGDEGHSAASLASVRIRAVIASPMKRAVMGVPSKCSTETKRAGSIPHSLTRSMRICASRFCSTRKTWSWLSMKSATASVKGKARSRITSRCRPSASSAESASRIAAAVEPKWITPKRVFSFAGRITGAGTYVLAV